MMKRLPYIVRSTKTLTLIFFLLYLAGFYIWVSGQTLSFEASCYIVIPFLDEYASCYLRKFMKKHPFTSV